MKSRTWPVLIIAFGTLVVLIGLSGTAVLRSAQLIYTEVLLIYEGYRQSELELYEIRSGIYLSSIYMRDFLLDPSHLTAESHRDSLLEIRASMTAHLDRLDQLIGRDEAETLHLLRERTDAYWESMEPIFDWTPSQKMALSSVFLRQQVLPRRDAVFTMASEIGELNAANFERQRERINSSQEQLRIQLLWMIAGGLALGLLVAMLSIFRVEQLERRAAESRLRTERAERELRRLSQQLVQAQEDERKAISRELHDQVGQMLTGLHMELGNLEGLGDSQKDEFEKRLSEAKQLAAQTMHVVRDLAMGLRPSMLDDLGLGPALAWQAREFSRHSGVPVSVQMDGTLDELPESHRTCVYRVVQEALTNCARHAEATDIRVTVHGRRDWLSLAVQDDGVGFPPDKTARRGMGLLGIEERVRELGGTVTVSSQPGKGTLVRVEVPLTQAVRI